MASRPPQPSTDRLVELIDQKHRLLTQMLAVGRRQSELIDAGDVSSLLRLLAAKQQLIAALRVVERELDPFRGDDPDRRTWASPEARLRCAEGAEACRRMLDEVLAMERDQEQRMSERRDGLTDRLRRTQHAHNAALAYRPHAGPPPTASTDQTTDSLDLTATG